MSGSKLVQPCGHFLVDTRSELLHLLALEDVPYSAFAFQLQQDQL